MAKLLCIETATTNCSVALSENESVIALREDNSKSYSHAERLHKFIEEVLKAGQTIMEEVDAIAVSKGPGSYTGLRIGVSAAKGLCYAADIPLISVPTLQSLAMGIQGDFDFIIPMLDARRMEVYSAIFTDKGTQIRETKAEILQTDSFESYLGKGKIAFVGNGAEKFQEICHHTSAEFVTALPSAKELPALAYDKWKQNDFEDVAYFEPYYLKDFIKG